jgi:large subunit ribosomal protein L13
MAAVNAKTGLAYNRLWHHVCADGLVVGRLASRIATILQGKHKPIFLPHNDCGDYVVVTMAKDLRFTGRKLQEKFYYKHTGFPGSLRKIATRDLMETDPATVLRRAVSGMLPKNRLRAVRLDRLKIFASSGHPYAANLAQSYEETPQREISFF